MRSGVPIAGENGRLGCVGEIALRHSGVDPLLDEGYVLVGEAPVVGEVAVAGFGKPGRHVAGLGDGLNEFAAAKDVLIGEQAERARAAGMVAGRAILIEDRRDLMAESDGAFGSLNSRRNCGDLHLPSE